MVGKRRIVVTGLGVFAPNGENLQDFWNSLCEGRDAFSSKYLDGTPIVKEKPTLVGSMFANYNPSKYFDFKDLKRIDYFAQYGLIASKEAVKDSGLDFTKMSAQRAGAVWGSGIGGGNIFEATSKEFHCDGKKVGPFFVPMLIPDILPGHISMQYGLKGPTYCTVSACSSSANALIDSYLLIKNDIADIIVSGGAEARSMICLRGFMALRALSNYPDSTASRPFDKDRDGFVLGEGAASLVLEEYEHAKARGAKIYAEIIGVGMSSDAYHLTAPDPEGTGCYIAMQNALKMANITPESIDYVNAHATSTPLGDIAEIKGMMQVFKDHMYQMSISSTKSVTGHLLGASGAIESIACILAIKDNIVPPTMHLANIDPNIDRRIDLTPNKAKNKNIKIAMNNNFGFGGHNCSLIFKQID